MREATARGAFVIAAAMAAASPACASWRAASPAVETAAKDQDVAAVLREVDTLDASILRDDHASFAERLSPDLVVNNPQNGVSQSGATGQRNMAGRISYARYDRVVEYAGRLEDMVVLMGQENVTPKGDSPNAGRDVVRRFTDIWRKSKDRWLLTVRQATIIAVK